MNKLILFGLTAVCGLALTAGTVTVPVGGLTAVSVAEGDASNLTERVVLGDRGCLGKDGEGLLTVPLGGIDANGGGVGVSEGELVLTPYDADSASVPEQPLETMNRAAMWLDASAPGTVVTSGTDVNAWLDVRETGSVQTGCDYWHALTGNALTNDCPQFVTKDGRSSVWFGGYSSGRTMNWCNAFGTNAVMSSIRHVFLVYGVYESHGNVLGLNKGCGSPAFNISDLTSGLPTGPISGKIYNDSFATAKGRVFVDGRLVDAHEANQLKVGGFQLLEYDCGFFLSGIASNFFNDRDNYIGKTTQYRAGGDYLSEVLVFTNTLVAADRQAVESWLIYRHFGKRRPVLGAATASGAELTLPGSALGREIVSLSGGGSVSLSGEGAAEFPATSEMDFVGRLLPGATELSSGFLWPLSLVSGVRCTTVQTGLDYRKIVAAADAGAGRAVKDGGDNALVTTVAKDVVRLDVSAGTLTLAAPRADSASGFCPGAVMAMMPNPDFESCTVTASGYEQFSNQEIETNGWHLVATAASGCSVVFAREGKSGYATSKSPYFSPVPAPQGTCFMLLQKGASAWTEVTVPTEGVYELSFLAQTRGGHVALPVEIQVGTEGSLLESLGRVRVPTYSLDWEPHRFRTPWLSAGTYQLWFKGLSTSDIAFAVDDLRLSRVLDGATDYPVPNGSFERLASDFNLTSDKTTNVAEGWTLVQTNGTVSTAPSVSVTTPWMASGYYFDPGYSRGGTACLTLHGTGAIARTTFVPTVSGRYRLKALVANRRMANDYALKTYVTATMTTNDAKTCLGRLAIAQFNLHEQSWPTSLQLVAGTPVTLELESDTSYNTEGVALRNATLVDDLAFEPCGLLDDGSFENGDGWRFTVFPKTGLTSNNRICRYFDGLRSYYGYDVYDGTNWAAIVQHDITWRTFDCPEAGLHRLRFFAHSRVSNNGKNGQNPVRAFWLTGEGAAQTNWIGTAYVTSTNFVEYSFAFNLPKADGLVFGLQGMRSEKSGAEYYGTDCTTVLDGLSLEKVVAANGGLPDVGSDVELTVAPTAKLQLDYVGSLKLKSLQLGTRRRSGIISAATDPDFVSGPGTLEVDPDGLILIFR